MAKASGSIDLKDGKAASAVATNYVTDIDNNNGITVHPASGDSSKVVINSSGMEIIVNDDDSVAFYGETARIGKDDESHIELDYHSFQMIDRDGNCYFSASDLRDESGDYSTSDSFVGDGRKTTFNLSMPASSSDYDVYVDGVLQTSADFLYKTAFMFCFNTAPASNARITTSVYSCDSSSAIAYTIGRRAPYTEIGTSSIAAGYKVSATGAYSHANGAFTEATDWASHAEGYTTVSNGWGSHSEGDHTEANGYASHAEGGYAQANGSYSHAEGDGTEANGLCSHASGRATIANGVAQTTIGMHNVVDNNDAYALIIGNGTSSAEPSNALEIDWDGNVIAQGMTGQIIMYAGTTAPNGWLKCDGSAISRTTYAKLFAVIGTTYGSGNGSTTFNLPNFNGRTPVGVGTSTATGATAHTLGQTAGSENAVVVSHTHQPLTANYFLNTYNTHSAGDMSGPSGSGRHYMYQATASSGNYWASNATTKSAGVSGTGANMMPYLGINFIIHVGIPTV